MATIYDVAKAAGVSPKTVSRVLNGDAPVRKGTVQAVRKAIGELGYVPSSAARAMRSHKSGLIGLITGAISWNVQEQFISGLPELFIVQGIQRAIESSDKTLLIADTGGRSDRIPELMRTFEEHRVEGLIRVAGHHSKVTMPKLAPHTKLVLANCFDDIGTPSVLPDDKLGQKRLVADLIAKGHRRIAYLTLGQSLVATGLRSEGYREALSEANIAFDPALVLTAEVAAPVVDRNAETQLLWDALDRVLGLEQPPTVICFGNDQMAMQAYGILRSRGLSLPEDISLAGYDNYQMITESLYPTLTSVELPYVAMGIRATQHLLGLIDGSAGKLTAPILVNGPVKHRDSVLRRPASLTQITSLGRKMT